MFTARSEELNEGGVALGRYMKYKCMAAVYRMLVLALRAHTSMRRGAVCAGLS